jgi:hypothetical protein
VRDGLDRAVVRDAVGSASMPAGGAATGVGGTAPRAGSSPLLWLAIMAGGGLLAVMGGARLRRAGHRAAHAVTGR